MRKLLGTAALLTAFATSAMAADVAVRAPARYVAPVSVYNWTGFYVGIEGGGAGASLGRGTHWDSTAADTM